MPEKYFTPAVGCSLQEINLSRVTDFGASHPSGNRSSQGPATLIASVSKEVRRFGNPVKAFEIVRELGLEGGRFSVAQWRPDERELDRPGRPDKSALLKATHEAASLVRTLNERLAQADAPDAVWIDAEDVFKDLDARYAR